MLQSSCTHLTFTHVLVSRLMMCRRTRRRRRRRPMYYQMWLKGLNIYIVLLLLI